jgi:mannonate dehydratase
MGGCREFAVSEPIKYGGPEREQLVANYRQSLENLGKAGIRTVVYNFMPVIDWIRTDLDYRLSDGTLHCILIKSGLLISIALS